MPEMVNKEADHHPVVERYLARIPADLHDLLLPDPQQAAEFVAAIKSLRDIEEERSYVMALQRRYELPLRPNESIKRTMIQVRLQILKKRREAEAEGKIFDPDQPLPVDPLE